MPIYEYECPKHGRYEVSQRITENALTNCTIESCGQPIRKLISSTSFALKGGGWYVTDYGKSGGGSSASSASSSSETKAEAKSADGGVKAEASSSAESGAGVAQA